MKNKKQKNISLIVSVVLLIVLIIVCIKLNFSSEFARREYGYETMGVYKDPSIQIEQKDLVYEGIEVLKVLKGELPVSNTTKAIKKIFLEEIPETIKNTEGFQKEQIEEYYNNNKESINSNLRIYSENDFINMVNKFQTIECNLESDYKSCKFSNEDQKIKIEFSYNNSQVITCYMKGNYANTFTLEF